MNAAGKEIEKAAEESMLMLEKDTIRVSLLSCAFVAIAACVTFGPSLRDEFSYDDFTIITKNARGLSALISPKAYFTRDYFRFSKEATYRPLVTATYALDYRLWELNPAGYHLTNLISHCLASVLCFFVFRSLGAGGGTSTVAAAIYAVHPVQTEAVCGVGFREDLLCAAFYLAAFALWPSPQYRLGNESASVEIDKPSPSPSLKKRRRVRARKEEANRARAQNASLPVEKGVSLGSIRLAASLACFVLALLSKEMALSFPLLIMAKDWRALWMSGNAALKRTKTLLPRHAMAWSIAIAAFILFIVFAGPKAPANAPVRSPLPQRLATFLCVAPQYLRLLIVPYPLCADYVIRLKGATLWLSALGSLAGLGALAAFCFWKRRRFPYALESFIAFFLLLGPVSNLVPLLHPMAVRYLTLPVAAFCWLVARGLAELRRPAPRNTLAGVLIAAYLGLSSLRVSDWRTSERLWTYEMRHNPGSSSAYNNVGNVEEKRNNIDKAIWYYSEAIKRGRNNTVAHNNLGSLLAKRGKNEEAAREFREAIRSDSTYAEAYSNLGVVLRRMGKLDEAAEQYAKALRINPDYAEAHNNYGNLLVQMSKTDDAIRQYEEALRINPRYTDARLSVARVLSSQGKADEAIIHYSEALKTEPGNSAIHELLGAALEKTGKLDDAIVHYRQAAQRRNMPQSYLTLADALVKAGHKDEAQEQYRNALSRAEATSSTALIEEARERLGLLSAVSSASLSQ